MLRIGDFSRFGQVSVRMLRHYDGLNLIKPIHVDPVTDYRYYSMEQLPRLNQILVLKDFGIPLEKIANLLEQDLPLEELQQLLRSKKLELSQQIQDTQAQINRISARLVQLNREGLSSPYDVIVKSVPTYRIASVRHTVASLPEMPKDRGMLIHKLYGWLKQQKISAVGCETVIYHTSGYTTTDIDMEFGIVIPETSEPVSETGQDKVTIRHLPASDRVASIFHSGMIQDITQGIAALFTWIGTNGYVSSGSIREIHLFGAETMRVRERPVVIELQIPIEISDIS